LIYLQNFKKWLQTVERKTISWSRNWICTFWKGLRFQLIEGRAMKWHQNHFEDLKAFTTKKTSEHKWHNTDKQILLTKKFKEL
jgi:hypothetical protein